MEDITPISILLLAATLKFSSPLILAALGGILSEKAGVRNVGLEGFMLLGAFYAVAFTGWTGNPWIGITGAILSGILAATILAVATIEFKANHLICGVAIIFLAYGLTGALNNSPFFNMEQYLGIISINYWSIPFIKEIPYVGVIIGEQLPSVYISIILLVLMNFLLCKTVLGLKLRASSENPLALYAQGVNVKLIRYFCVIISGMLAGLGGGFLTLGIFNYFTPGITAGRGFLALSAVIIGRKRPIETSVIALLFGFLYAFQMYAPDLNFTFIPPVLLILAPYIISLALLGISSQVHLWPGIFKKSFTGGD